jgi:hypothetical protein
MTKATSYLITVSVLAFRYPSYFGSIVNFF